MKKNSQTISHSIDKSHLNSQLSPYPIYFICRNKKKWHFLFEYPEELPDLNQIFKNIVTNEDCWIILTYFHLKQQGLDVRLSENFVPGEICVVSSLDHAIQNFSYSSFVVGCRSDGPKSNLSDISIVQNIQNVESKKDIFIPHWPQPGLISRAESRGRQIKNLVFKGSITNLHESFRSSEFLQDLENLGVKLVISSESTNGSADWHDYSAADLVIAVRNLTEEDARVKPASKLVNAWMAGSPALLGPEPAFQHLRRSELDYIEVRTPKQAVEAIHYLQNSPDVYQKMVINGYERAKDFTPTCIAQKWRNALSDVIVDEYIKWSTENMLQRKVRFPARAFQQKISNIKSLYHRENGRRLITG